jgi:serine/threonine protein phosphatase PrpC
LLIFVLSDGLWDSNDVKEPISQIVDFIKGQDSTMVGIEFIHFGNDKAGWQRMEELDNFISKPLVPFESIM